MADSVNKDGKLYICATAAEGDLDQAAYEALTWVEVENIVELPVFGVTENILTQNYIAGNSGKRKGNKNGADTTLVLGFDSAKTGQAAVRTAAATKFTYPLKRELNDKATAAATANTIIYTRAVIGIGEYSGGASEDFVHITHPIGIDQTPIMVASA